MTIPGPADHGYVVLDRRRLGAAHHAPVDAAVAALRREGWSGQPAIDDIEILRGPRSRLAVRQVGRRHFLIGDWRARGQPLSVLVALHPGPAELARAVVRGGWGRYILVWRADDGRLVILRDPSGATDCVWWRFKGAVLVAHEPPRAMDPLLPKDLAIDWSILREIATAPELLGDRLALTGLSTVNPGAVALISESVETEAVWRPSDSAAPMSDGMRAMTG